MLQWPIMFGPVWAGRYILVSIAGKEAAWTGKHKPDKDIGRTYVYTSTIAWVAKR
jgi:hypothetical protein